jgi:hypothetical protein
MWFIFWGRLNFPLVSGVNPMKNSLMSRLKTLSLPIATLLATWAATPVQAQNTNFTASIAKTFRQSRATQASFRGGSFDVALRDGSVVYQAGCSDAEFFNPSTSCPLGSTGFTVFGRFDASPDPEPFLSVSQVTTAFSVEPALPDSVFLGAAPFSRLPRPLYGFTDNSVGLFYNLFEPANLREYKVSSYRFSRGYLADELTRMNQELVPGSYFFKFPKLKNPSVPITIATTIRALPDGYAKVNNQFSGVRFDTGLGFDSDGFMRVSFNRPTTFRWSGLGTNLVNPNVDRLYISIRYLLDPSNPLSETTKFRPNPVTGELEGPASLFPGFVSGSDPRILLPSPFTNFFNIPPIFPLGSTGVVELELNRNLASNAAIYDMSSRLYQIPIRFVNSYSDYANRSFGTNRRKIGLTEDFDGDRVNNMTEWVLNTRAQDASSVPKPDPGLIPGGPVVPPTVPPTTTPTFFGILARKPVGYFPDVVGVLQRSTSVAPAPDVWVDMVSDANWTVIDDGKTIGIVSKTGTAALPTLPPGTAGHKYRWRVALTGL